MSRFHLPDSVRETHGAKAPLLGIAGGVILIVSGLLSWCYDNRVLGNIAPRFFPAGVQLYAMALGILAVILAVLLRKRPAWMSPGKGLRILGIASIVFVLGTALWCSCWPRSSRSRR